MAHPPPFTKPASTIPDQIVILQRRGLVINDIPLAEHFLTHVGYYRLAGYWQIFQNDPVTHTFIPGTTFEQVLELYNFDRELRLLVYDAIERIEISFRTVMVQHMCMAHGPNWYVTPTLAEDPEHYEANRQQVGEELARSKEQFIIHHDTVYGAHTYPPAWKTMQVLSFGTLSKIYSNIATTLPEKNQIARSLGLPNYVYFVSWMQSIAILRNLCAHHSRISNRTYDFIPHRLATAPHLWIAHLPPTMHHQRMLYNQLCSVKYLLDRVSPASSFTAKLLDLIARHPGINMRNMGFLPGWEKEPLWRSATVAGSSA